VFVANPAEAGDGPGGVQLLSAARLSGSGTLNNAGYLTLGGDITTFTCLDHTMNGNQSQIESSSSVITSQLKRVVEGNASRATLRLLHATALSCAANCNRVYLVGEAGAVCVQREPQESVVQFYEKVAAALNAQPPALHPSLTALSEAALAAPASGAACVLYAGGRDVLEDIVRANPNLNKQGCRLTVVDVTSGDAEVKVVDVSSGLEETTPVLYAKGSDYVLAPTWP